MTPDPEASPATELPHRLADASIRATRFAGDIRAAFGSFDGGDPVPLARLASTSLVYRSGRSPIGAASSLAKGERRPVQEATPLPLTCHLVHLAEGVLLRPRAKAA